MIKVTPPQKSEAWKFSPKPLVSKMDFLKPEDLKIEKVRSCLVALGPHSHQFESVTLGELEEDGYIEIEWSSFESHSSRVTERASLDQTVRNLFPMDFAKIKVNRSLPSNLWITPLAHARCLQISLADGVHQSIVLFESDVSKSHAEGFLYPISIGKGSSLELGVAMNSETSSFSKINVDLSAESKFDCFSMLSGSATYKRLEVLVNQNSKNSSCTLNGICFAKSNSQLEFHSNIFHLSQDQTTVQNYKTLSNDKAKSIFGGRVHLTESASGAAVEQLNNNLLLSNKASVDSQPELNIYQDDVKASHGATTSSIDEDHLFYFASRGFKPDQSKRLLLEAFCKSTLDNLNDPGIKKHFQNLILEELHNESE
jgi:Fe-S cluster assembly scaffold protein SufB